MAARRGGEGVEAVRTLTGERKAKVCEAAAALKARALERALERATTKEDSILRS